MQNEQEGEREADPNAQRKKEGVARRLGPRIGALAAFSFGAVLNYFGNNPKILYFPALCVCVWIMYETHRYVQSKQGAMTPGLPPAASRAAQPGANEAPIAVYPPGEFTLASGEWRQKTLISVTNTRSVPLYSVFIKIWVVSGGISSEQIEVQVEEGRAPAPVLKVGPVEIRSDYLMWDFVDANQREAVLVMFYVIAPMETRTCTVSAPAGTRSIGRAGLLDVKTEATRTLEAEGKVAFIVQVPDTGTIKGVRFKIGAVGP